MVNIFNKNQNWSIVNKPHFPQRFKTVTNEEMEKFFDSRQAKSTKRNTAWGLKIFQDWNMEVYGTALDMLTVNVSTLASHLSRFYCEARP